MNFQEGSYEPSFFVHYWLRFRRPHVQMNLERWAMLGGPVGVETAPCGAEQPNSFAPSVAVGTLVCEWKTSDAKPMRNPTMNPEMYI